MEENLTLMERFSKVYYSEILEDCFVAFNKIDNITRSELIDDFENNEDYIRGVNAARKEIRDILESTKEEG